MATIYRNPMPRKGALFIENPRHKSSAKQRKARNDAAKAMKLYKSGKAKTLKAAWRMVKKNPARLGLKRKNPWYETPNMRKDGIKAPRHQKAANMGYAGSRKAKARSAALAKAWKQLKGKKMSPSARAKKANQIADQILAKKGRARTSAQRASGRVRTAAQKKRDRGLKLLGGRGLTRKQLEKALKLPRKKQLELVKELPKIRGRKPKKGKGKGKTGTRYARRVGARGKAASAMGVPTFRMASLLPFLNPKHRMNPKFAPIKGALDLLNKGAVTVSRIPVIKHVAWAVPAAGLAYGVYYVHTTAAPLVVPALEAIPVVGPVIARNAYLTTSLVLGTALGFLASRGYVNKTAATALAVSAVSAGVILDKAAPLAVAAADAGIDPAFLEAEVMAAQDAELGDGMFYHLGANTQALGMLNAYADADLGDAQFAPDDMSAQEVSAALSGHYYESFPAPPHRRKKTGRYSRHAGMMGHRYGWLIKMIGPQQFCRLAELSPKQRHDIVRLLRRQAMATVSQATSSQVESASAPLSGAFNGHEGHHSSSYGALMYAGREIY